MKINRIYLENYRIHEKLELEFSSGINLLLGSNGKGKSSILEAIGLALFNSKQRNNTLKEAVTIGKKNAKIEVNFTGIDGEEYIVTRKLPKTDIKLCRVSDNVIIEGKDEKIKELCGIKGEITDIYDNIIVAKQNEFLSVFKETPTNREKIFNRIFNTDIYLDIYNGYAKTVLDRYDKKLTEKNSISNTLKEHIDDPEEIENDLEQAQLKAQEVKVRLDETIKKGNEIRNQLFELEKIKIEYEKEKSTQNLLQHELNSLELNLDKINQKIKEIEIAEKICKEKEHSYLLFQKIKESRDLLKSELKEIAQKKESYLLKEKEKFELKNLDLELTGKLNLLSTKQESQNKLLLEKQDEIKNLVDRLTVNENLEREYKEKLFLIVPLLENVERIENEIKIEENNLLQENRIVSERKLNLSKILENLSLLDKEDIEKQILEIEEKKLKKLELEKENEILRSQIKENRKASQLLKTSTCPYLKEECKNLNGKDIESFFTERIDALISKGMGNASVISELEVVLNNEKALREKEFKIRQLKKDEVKLTNEIEKEELLIENLKEKIQKLSLQFENLKLRNNFQNKEVLSQEKIILTEKISSLEIDELRKEIEKLEVSVFDDEKKIEKLEIEKSEIENKIKELEINLKNIENYLNENKSVLDLFDKKSIQIENEELKLKDLEEEKEIYLENMRKSSEKEKLVFEFEDGKINKNKLEKELVSKCDEIIILEKTLQNYNEDGLIIKEKEFNELNREFSKQLGELNTQIKGFEEKLIKINEQNNELKELQNEIELLNKKIKLATLFRNNIKNLGKEVAKNMLYKIEDLATVNFRKITGRSEKIRWSNDDNDKYTVYLMSEEKTLNFEQLSGGEQVAVTISIRSAMSNLFTDSKFSIFDEPTNNLDTERRQSLADSIGEILKNLEQAIIVTHDDTFKEMAQKVIVL